MSGDAYHNTTLPPADGEGARKCMVAALRDARIDAADIDYLNAHGTSTRAGDIGETNGIKRAFGDAAKTLIVSSTKSTTGHLLGRCRSGRSYFLCIINSRSGHSTDDSTWKTRILSVTLITPQTSRAMPKLRTTVSNSFGFGGTKRKHCPASF